MSPYHPAVQHVLQFFECAHLPPQLQEVSQPFRDLAYQIADRDAQRDTQSPETTVALRKLLESKDAAVRSAL